MKATEYNSEVKQARKWLDYMKGRLDDYEVHRNEYLAESRMPAKNYMFYKDVVLPFAENTLIMDYIAAGEGLGFPRKENKGGEKEKASRNNNLKIRVFIDGNELCASYPEGRCIKEDNCQGREHCNTCRGDIKEATPALICYPNHFPYLILPRNDAGDMETVYNSKITGLKKMNGKADMSDVEVAMPTEHAFYSILENFIRNSAKHNSSRIGEDGLEIYIDIRSLKKEATDFYYITLYDNISCQPMELIRNKIREGVQANLLKETGEQNNENLGVADMKINAHLLYNAEEMTEESLREALRVVFCTKCTPCNENGKPNTPLKHLSEPDSFPFAEVTAKPESNKVKNEKGSYRFGYRFRLARSKKICWIGKEADTDLKNLEHKGIYCFNKWEDFLAVKGRSIASFEFALLEWDAIKSWNEKSEEIPDDIEKKFLRMPFRVLVNKPIKNGTEVNGVLSQLKEARRVQFVQEKITCTDAYVLQKQCWENWLRRWGLSKSGKAHILITFENEAQLKNWNDKLGEQSPVLTTAYKLKPSQTQNNKCDFPIEGGTNKVIVYDHHGAMGELFKNTPNFVGCTNFYEVFEKNSKDFSDLAFPPSKYQDLHIYRLAEAGLINILIADERVVEMKNKPGNPKAEPPFFSQMRKANICLVDRIIYKDKIVDVHQDKGDSEWVLTLSDNCTYGKEGYTDSRKFDMLIIHRTFVNKLSGEEKPHQFFETVRKSIPFVIVTSGGGTPHNMKEAAFKFANLEMLTQNASAYTSKIQLSSTFLNLTNHE